MSNGSSYEERLREMEGEDTFRPTPCDTQQEQPQGQNSPPEPASMPELDPMPIPVHPPKVQEPEAMPRWAEPLMKQQEQILNAIKRMEADKPASAPPRPVAPPISLTPLERQTQELVATVGRMEHSTAELIKANSELTLKNMDVLRDSKNFQADTRVKMQRELETYQKLFADDVYAPLLTEMAQIYITCWKYISQQKDEKIRDDLQSMLLESMEEMFEDNNVEISRTPVGQERSLRRCKTRKTVPTGDESLHGMVALSLNPSFCMGKKVLIKELVDTYIFDPALKMEEPEVVPTTGETDPEENLPDQMNEAPDQEETEAEQSATVDTNENDPTQE